MRSLSLVDRGKPGLDEDIGASCGDSPPPGPPITLAQLLSHTGGLDEVPGRQFDPTKGARAAAGEGMMAAGLAVALDRWPRVGPG
jgi:CubicO group peptidase (beta-lactamase class C family)